MPVYIVDLCTYFCEAYVLVCTCAYGHLCAACVGCHMPARLCLLNNLCAGEWNISSLSITFLILHLSTSCHPLQFLALELGPQKGL